MIYKKPISYVPEGCTLVYYREQFYVVYMKFPCKDMIKYVKRQIRNNRMKGYEWHVVAMYEG